MRTVLILLLISASKANYTKRCNNSSKTEVTLVPSEDIEGRYKVEYCTKADKNVSQWVLYMRYISTTLCDYDMPPREASMHSIFLINVENDLNCTEQVCFSTLLDLVFTNQCYYIQTRLKTENGPNKRPFDSYHYITNNVTQKNFTDFKPPSSQEIYNGGLVIVNWDLGSVPALDYSVTVRDNETKAEFNTVCNVTGKFMSNVSCNASLPLGQCYYASLHQKAYWTAANKLFGNITDLSSKTFCVGTPFTPVVSSSPMGEWPTAVGMAALVLLAVALCCVVRRRYVLAWQKRVLENWLKMYDTSNKPIKPPKVDGNILLLYARDCASFKCAAERLGALVHRATGCPVIDVYSGASMRLWASGGDEWLRLMLERDDTRVLLLQSPAGALLAAELADTRAGPALAAPLLGSLVSWRQPHAADALLALALRLLASAPPSAPYKKHYVANISGLGADMAPSVTPYRRYTLSATVVSLLRDLQPSLKLSATLDVEPVLESRWSDLEPLLQQFKEAADAFTEHVRYHPDYLADELLFQ